MQQQVEALRQFAEKAKADGIGHVVVLGMGGSSLAPEVFQRSFGNQPVYPALMVLDSTHPAANQVHRSKVDSARICGVEQVRHDNRNKFFFLLFLGQIKAAEAEPGEHFAAITDPGTPLEKMAGERKFRAVFTAPEDIGGRYSALTVFGSCRRR